MISTLFNCHQCEGPVQMVTGEGRTREYRPGIKLAVPDDFGIPTCQGCGETYLTTAEAQALEERLKHVYAEYCRTLIDAASKGGGVTRKELERAAGVTPTYFSHVTSGRKQASLALVRLLQAFVLYPSEIERHLRGADWHTAVQPNWHRVLKQTIRYASNDNSIGGSFEYVQSNVSFSGATRLPPPANWEDCAPLEGPPSTSPLQGLSA